MNTLIIPASYNGENCYLGVVDGLKIKSVTDGNTLDGRQEVSQSQILYGGNNNFFSPAQIGFNAIDAVPKYDNSITNFFSGEKSGFDSIGNSTTVSHLVLSTTLNSYAFCLKKLGSSSVGYWLGILGYAWADNRWVFSGYISTKLLQLPDAPTSYNQFPQWVSLCTNVENNVVFLLGIFEDHYTAYPLGDGNGRYYDVQANIRKWATVTSTGENPPSNLPIGPDNPYEPGGPSGPGGGDGSFDNDSDQIVDSSLPTISSANTGFTRIYNPSLSQVQALARYLWTDESVIQTIWNHIKQYFEDPMQAIIGFNLVPVSVPNGGTQNFALMYIDTGVEMTVAASQFVDVDCGTFELKEYYGSALDYAPNTKVSCFLPFIGTVSLNTDEVMGRTLQVKYRVDICSGSCVAKIGVDGNFIYQYSGHCAINIPISSADFSSYVSSAISVAQLAAGAIAAGAGGVMASSAVDASQQTNQVVTTTQITNTARNPATGRQITTGTMTRVETRESPNDQSSTQASFSGITPQNISNTVGQIMSSKPNINHSGSFSGNSGYLGVRRPFLIIERPNMCMPSNFQALNGFPSMITLELSSCKGFTRVQQVQLTGFYATNPEQAEILQLLKSGVIL